MRWIIVMQTGFIEGVSVRSGKVYSDYQRYLQAGFDEIEQKVLISDIYLLHVNSTLSLSRF